MMICAANNRLQCHSISRGLRCGLPPLPFHLPHMHSNSLARVRRWLGTDRCNPSLYEVYTGVAWPPASSDSRSDRTWREQTKLYGVQNCRDSHVVVQQCPGPEKRYGTPGFLVGACFVFFFSGSPAGPPACIRSSRVWLFVFGIYVLTDMYNSSSVNHTPNCNRLCILNHALGTTNKRRFRSREVSPRYWVYSYMCLYILWFFVTPSNAKQAQ